MTPPGPSASDPDPSAKDAEEASIEGSEPQQDGVGLFKGVARHSLIYGIGMIISRAVSFLMLPIYLQYLDAGDLGVMFLVDMTLDFIAIIGGSQLALGVFRFYHKTDDPEQKRQVVSTSFFLVGCLYTVLGTVTFLSASFLSDLIFGNQQNLLVIQLASANLAFSAFVIVPMSFARVRDLSHIFVGANVGKLILAVTLNITFLVVMETGVVGVYISSLISNVIVGLFLGVWLVRNVGRRVSGAWIQQLLRYGVPLMGMQLATFIATFSDRFFLNAASNPDAVGLYGLGYQFGFLLAVVGFTPVDMVWGPKRFEVARQEGYDEVLSRGFVIVSVLLITTAVGIVLYVEDVIQVMGDPQYHTAWKIVPLILIAYIMQCWASVQDIGILVKEQTRYLTIANFAAAGVAVVAYVTLIPTYLAWGAAIGTVLAFTTRWALTYWFSQRLWPIRYRWRPVLTVVAWGTVVCTIALLAPSLPLLASLAVRTGFVVVYFIGLWFLPILDDSERETALKMIGSVLGMLRSRKGSAG